MWKAAKSWLQCASAAARMAERECVWQQKTAQSTIKGMARCTSSRHGWKR